MKRLKKIDIREDFLKEISVVDWFSNCGCNENIELNCSINYVSNWNEAQLFDNKEEWDKLVSNSREKLFNFITKKLSYSTRDFNILVASTRESTYYKSAVEKINEYIKKNGINFKFSNLITWLILNGAVEDAFRDQKGCPNFFTDMFIVIKRGHCPCGWKGSWPQGTLYVY